MICLNCFNNSEFEIRQEKEIIAVKGDDIEVTSDITYCKKCGEKVWNNDLDNMTLLKAYEIYKKKHNLLTSSEIKAIREKYELSQVTFSKVLGFGEKTIARYENGSIQDPAQNNLILLAKNINNFEKLFDIAKDRLTNAEIQKIEVFLNARRPEIYSQRTCPTVTYSMYYGGFTYEEHQRQYQFDATVSGI